MKIALVCPYDLSRHGGVQGHVRQLGAHLTDDHEVRIIGPVSAPPGTLAAERLIVPVGAPVPVPYNRSVAPVALSPLAAQRTVRALRAFSPHIIHVHEPLVPVVSVAAVAAGRGPVVATFHAWSDADWLYRMASPVGRRIVAGLAARIGVSPAAAEFAAGSLGVPLGGFRVIPNGVDVAAFASAEPIPELADPERQLLLFVGRLEPRKGLDVLVRAFLRLRASRPRLRLCVVGEGGERQRCQQMVPPSIRPDVLFVGAVSERGKARYYASADVYVAPNTSGESFGIVLLEAMAAGLPVVASDIPGFRTVMKDGQQGRLVPPGDASALAGAIDTLLSNDKLRTAMARDGRGTADAYAWPLVAARIEDVYRHAWRSAS